MEESPAFGGEQMGSAVMVKGLKETETKLNGALVLEMVGCYTDEKGSQKYPEIVLALPQSFPDVGNFIAVVGNENSSELTLSLTSAMKQNPGLPVESLIVSCKGHEIPETRLSDNSSFWDFEYPAVMITDTSFLRNKNYHTEQDKWDTLDFGRMSELVRRLLFFLEKAGH